MNLKKQEYDKKRAYIDMEEQILVCLLSNGYGAREGEVISKKLIEYFRLLESVSK